MAWWVGGTWRADIRRTREAEKEGRVHSRQSMLRRHLFPVALVLPLSDQTPSHDAASSTNHAHAAFLPFTPFVFLLDSSFSLTEQERVMLSSPPLILPFRTYHILLQCCTLRGVGGTKLRSTCAFQRAGMESRMLTVRRIAAASQKAP